MRRFIFSVLVSAVCSAGLMSPVHAESFTDDQKKEMETIIHDYLMAHPEVLRDMAVALDTQDKQAAKDSQNTTLNQSAAEIFRNVADGVVGNPKGDVTIVEFMDYNCGWCHKSIKEVQALIAEDPNVRVVMKEFPIFGAGSEYAARAALASVKQNKYWAFHQALFGTSGQVTAEVVDKVAKTVGLDVAKMKTDMKDPAIDAELGKTQDLASALQFSGTPGFIVDTAVFPGYESKEKLMAAVNDVRAQGGCKICGNPHTD